MTAATVPPEAVHVRAGLPRLRERLERGDPATVVVYGSSMTVNGAYLAALPDRLRRAYPHANVSLRVLGRNGFDTVAAAFDAQSVAAEAPDVVVLEFAINDFTTDAQRLIVPALLGILAQIRALRPACEFAFVYLARAVDVEAGDHARTRVHDALARVAGIPAVDLGAVTAHAVAQGRATLYDGPHALTVDGVHHTPYAATAIGEPFASALLGIIGAATGSAPVPATDPVSALIADPAHRLAHLVDPGFRFDGAAFGRIFDERYHINPQISTLHLLAAPRVRDVCPSAIDLFLRARRVRPIDFVASEGWGLGGTTRIVDNFDHGAQLLMATEVGATLRFERYGPFLALTGFGCDAGLRVAIDGHVTEVTPMVSSGPDGQIVLPLAITDGLSDRAHVIEVTATGTMVAISDVFAIEAPA